MVDVADRVVSCSDRGSLGVPQKHSVHLVLDLPWEVTNLAGSDYSSLRISESNYVSFLQIETEAQSID